jgi:excinuclease UvrABC ATPase subunit
MLLAPIIAERKGEHVQLMADLQAQGFIRARIDGEIYELDQPPELDLRKKHNLDAIVDRFKVKEDIRLRLPSHSKPLCDLPMASRALPIWKATRKKSRSRTDSPAISAAIA